MKNPFVYGLNDFNALTDFLLQQGYRNLSFQALSHITGVWVVKVGGEAIATYDSVNGTYSEVLM